VGMARLVNNFVWSITIHFSASDWTIEGKVYSICDKMILTVSYFLNTGETMRWCLSRVAPAKFEKLVNFEHAVAYNS
jgi:hypothetical protein